MPLANYTTGVQANKTVGEIRGKPLAPNFYAIVLRIDDGRYLHACRAGVAAFGEAVRSENPILADDIQTKLRELALQEGR